MKSLGLISQVLTIGLSIAIALLYIRPTFDDIGQIQTEINEYQTQREKIEKVNAELAAHVANLSSINPADIQRLTTYMPRFVDEVGVMRDLQFVVEQSGLIFKNVGYGGSGQRRGQAAREKLDPVQHQFSIVAEGTYSQVKDLFSLLEQNEYPLEVHTANIQPLEGGFLSVDLTIVTYEDALVALDGS